MNKSRNQDFTR